MSNKISKTLSYISSKTTKLARRIKMPNLNDYAKKLPENANSLGTDLRDFSEGLSLCIRAGIRITFWLLAGFAACCAAYVIIRVVITVANHILKLAGI